jgi:signal transduction histidine kinase
MSNPRCTAVSASTELLWDARYADALSSCLNDRRRGPAGHVQTIGHTALIAGFDSLGLIGLHERTILALASIFEPDSSRSRLIRRASWFFTQAMVPFEAARRASVITGKRLQIRNRTLHLHNARLARANKLLQSEIVRRRLAETRLHAGREEYRGLLNESHLMQKKLRLLTRQIISAQEEERKEISRELHDEVVQTLVGINVELSALSKTASVGLHALRAKITHTQQLVENSVNAVHRFARELRPAVLDDLGLIPALHSYSRSVAERRKIKIHLTAFAGVEALGNAQRTVLFRVAQEALTNVVRHAHATQVRLAISAIPGAIRMEIADNGRAFAVERTFRARNPKRLGLIGMKERVEMIGGSLKIESTPGIGTVVRAEIPLASAKDVTPAHPPKSS